MGLLDRVNAAKSQEVEEKVEEKVEEVVEDDVEKSEEELDESSGDAEETENEKVSADEKLRNKKQRELFEDEVKDGKWDEYQTAVSRLKEFAKSNGVNYLRMISGVNTKFRSGTSTSTYTPKAKDYNEKEKVFYAAKEKFDEDIAKVIETFQKVIDSLSSELSYPGERAEVQRTAFIQKGKEFKDFLAEQN